MIGNFKIIDRHRANIAAAKVCGLIPHDAIDKVLVNDSEDEPSDLGLRPWDITNNPEDLSRLTDALGIGHSMGACYNNGHWFVWDDVNQCHIADPTPTTVYGYRSDALGAAAVKVVADNLDTTQTIWMVETSAGWAGEACISADQRDRVAARIEENTGRPARIIPFHPAKNSL